MKKFCIDCGKNTVMYRAKRCKSCLAIHVKELRLFQEEIWIQYKQGARLRDLAFKFDCSMATIMKLLKENHSKEYREIVKERSLYSVAIWRRASEVAHPSIWEKKVKRAFEDRKILFEYQKIIKFSDNLREKFHFGNKFCIADFVVNSNIIVEIDGWSHQIDSKYDRKRDAICRYLGYTILRFTHEEVKENLELCIAKVKNIITIPTKLLNVQINLLNACNLKCVFCGKNSWPKDSIDFEILQTLIKDLTPDTTVVFSGGESLLYSKLSEILRLLNARKIQFGIFTNGAVLKNIDFDALSNAQWIRISVMSDQKDIIKQIMGQDILQIQRKFISILKEKQANLQGECVVTPINKNALPTEQFWQIPILLYDLHNDNLETKLPNVIGMRGEPFIIPNFHALVDPSGTVFPDCIAYSDNERYNDGKELREKFCLGNLNENSINEIFYSKEAEDIRNELRYYYHKRLNLLNRTQRYAQKNRLLYDFLKKQLFL